MMELFVFLYIRTAPRASRETRRNVSIIAHNVRIIAHREQHASALAHARSRKMVWMAHDEALHRTMQHITKTFFLFY